MSNLMPMMIGQLATDLVHWRERAERAEATVERLRALGDDLAAVGCNAEGAIGEAIIEAIEDRG